MKSHKKLYKRGKLWVVATLFSLALGLQLSGTTQANADQVQPVQTTAAQITSPAKSSSVAPVTSPASAQAATASTNSAPVVMTTTPSTPQASQAPDQSLPTAQAATGPAKSTAKLPNVNEAYLDQVQLHDNQLTVSGWHATNDAVNRPNHDLIVLDTSQQNRELGRIKVTNLARPDVARAYPNVRNAATSGFSGQFILPADVIQRGDTLTLVSRYTASADGNRDYVDYWFKPIPLGQQNLANLDQVKVVNNQLVVSGWHASNQATGRDNHYLILFDRTSNHEVGRVKLPAGLARPDVARVYPLINNAGQAGFQASFNLNQLNLNHQLQLISRYSSSADGNSDYLDYWFPPFGGTQNQAYLDQLNWSDGQHLQVAGWHAADPSPLESHHYLILFDNTSRQQVAMTTTTTVERPDVARAYPTITAAGHAGFKGSFDLANLHLNPQHQYFLVSRYSTDAHGNSGNGQYTDAWLKLPFANQRAFYFDHLQMTNTGLQLAGWMIDSNSSTKPYAYAIVLNDGHEIARQKLTLTDRVDLARLNPQVFNSLHSGFNTTIPLDPAKLGQHVQILLRFTNDPAGNGQASDQLSPVYPTNVGYLDQLTVTPTQLEVAGWHLSDQTVGKPYQYLIVLGANGREVQRWQLTNLQARPDVLAAYPATLGNDHPGFSTTLPLNANLYGQTIRLIHRYSDDPAGNGHYTDWETGPIATPSAVADPRGIQRFGGNTYYFDPTTRQPVTNRWVEGVYFGADGRLTNGQFSTRVIDWFLDREGRLTYSMEGSRDGRDGTADCSGSMTTAVHAAGATTPGWLYSTNTIGPYLQRNGYQIVYQGYQEYIPQYGDIVVWGYLEDLAHQHIVIASGSSDNQRAISVCYLTKGQPGTAIQEVNYDWYWSSHGRQYQTVFRLTNQGRN